MNEFAYVDWTLIQSVQKMGGKKKLDCNLNQRVNGCFMGGTAIINLLIGNPLFVQFTEINLCI